MTTTKSAFREASKTVMGTAAYLEIKLYPRI
jgi:hypothetical protein